MCQKIVKNMPPDIEKQWFRIGGVAFSKVSNTSKKLWKIRQKTFQNEPKIHWKVIRSPSKNLLKKRMQKQQKYCENRYRKWGLKKWFFRAFCYLWIQGVPGWSQGPSQVPSRVKLVPKWVSTLVEDNQECCPEAFWKRFSNTHALNIFF